MMNLFNMAWKNLWRNKRRTLITAVAISIGLALLIISSSLGDGTHGAQVRQGVGQMAGHVVVQQAGYQSKKEVEMALQNAPKIVEKLRGSFPEATVVQRIFFDGLLTSPMGSSGVGITAVNPEEESQVNDFHSKIVKGRYLTGDKNKVVIGDSLAETLSVEVGDKLVLMSQQGQDIQSHLFRVQGIFHTGIAEMDGFYIQLPLSDAQSLLALGTGVSQVSIHLDEARDTLPALAQTQQLLSGIDGVEILSWQEALPELYTYIVFDDAGLYLFIFIIAFIISLGILNTQLMSVLERVREFGVMLALGLSPRELAVMVLMESAILGTISVIGGVALGLLANWPLTVNGLDYTEMLGETMEAGGVAISSHIYGDLSPEKVVVFALGAIALTVIASIYPIIKASRLEPVEAMHHV